MISEREFRQVDVFTADPYRGNPVAVVLDGERPDDRRDAARSPTGRTCPRPPSCCPPPTRQPTTGCASSPPSASCRSPATRRSARAAPGSSTAARPAQPDVIVQQCAAGLDLDPARRSSGWPSPRRRCGGRVRSRPTWSDQLAAILGIEHSRRGRRGVDRQRTRLGRRAAGQRRRGAGAASPSFADLDIGVVGPVPAGRAARARAAGVLPEGRRAGRRPGHRQPERLGRPVAARLGPGAGARTWPARARSSAAPAGSTSPTPTTRSGSAATPSSASPATCQRPRRDER